MCAGARSVVSQGRCVPIAVSAAGAGHRAVTGWDMQGPQTATLPMPTDWDTGSFPAWEESL